MRKILILTTLAITIALAVVVVSVTSHPNDERSAAPARREPAPARSTSAAGPSLQELLSTRVTTLGSQISVGIPATITLEDVAGKTVYARATMGELQQLPAGEASALLSGSAIEGYRTVYAMPVSLTVIGIVDDARTNTVQTVDLSATNLGRFTIATHPGATPLPSSNTASSPSCRGLPTHTSAQAGQTVTWCIHAYADDGSNAPTGGQYETAAGTYRTPITWASKRFAAPEIP